MATTGPDEPITFVISVAAELAGMHPQPCGNTTAWAWSSPPARRDEAALHETRRATPA